MRGGAGVRVPHAVLAQGLRGPGHRVGLILRREPGEVRKAVALGVGREREQIEGHGAQTPGLFVGGVAGQSVCHVDAGVRVRCNVHERLVYGHPAQQILEVAAQETPDLLVMGVQGRGALDLLMFGSTANHVVRHAACPVLTVRPAAAGA